MGPLRELLAIDPRQALEFFVVRLQDVSEPAVDRQELLYNASLPDDGHGGCTVPAADGFFADQMRPRHDIRWYAELGAGFFRQAARHERALDKARMLDAIARRFELWRQRHALLSRDLRDQPFLLTPPLPRPPDSG